jgi:hypothetical protein
VVPKLGGPDPVGERSPAPRITIDSSASCRISRAPRRPIGSIGSASSSTPVNSPSSSRRNRSLATTFCGRAYLHQLRLVRSTRRLRSPLAFPPDVGTGPAGQPALRASPTAPRDTPIRPFDPDTAPQEPPSSGRARTDARSLGDAVTTFAGFAVGLPHPARRRAVPRCGCGPAEWGLEKLRERRRRSQSQEKRRLDRCEFT